MKEERAKMQEEIDGKQSEQEKAEAFARWASYFQKKYAIDINTVPVFTSDHFRIDAGLII